eukprot:CAMPEP_0183543216 /NCGR_PEP_ID=MMETSP0371-20130417/43913_1 /TAXON_ID=268820 /ORGANISM="Peridinium aciculiferum, Strain PAER-2" /LENGTH=58 /DNA_ID=CAMNT_0025744641 /DNA_START=19 /DNA_END=191 /DNA_ORIENTATION=+
MAPKALLIPATFGSAAAFVAAPQQKQQSLRGVSAVGVQKASHACDATPAQASNTFAAT